jgi:outer membrane protein OmpU
MKNILFATTALVATAGIASADLVITGGASAGLIYHENNTTTNNTVGHTEIDFNIVGSGESSNGIAFGASVDLDAGETAQVVGGGSGGGASDAEVFVSMNGLTITMGAVGNAGVVLNTAEVGFDGINSNSHVDAADDSAGDHDLHVAYSTAGFTFAAAAGLESDDTSMSFSGTMGSLNFGIGYADDDSLNTSYTSIGLGYTVDNLSLQGLMVNVDANGTKTENVGLSISYAMNDLTMAAAMSDTDTAGANASYGFGASYDLGGGLSIAGGIGSDASNSTADLGLVMSF